MHIPIHFRCLLLKELRAGFEKTLAAEKKRWKKRLLEERQVADEALEAAQVCWWDGRVDCDWFMGVSGLLGSGFWGRFLLRHGLVVSV